MECDWEEFLFSFLFFLSSRIQYFIYIRKSTRHTAAWARDERVGTSTDGQRRACQALRLESIKNSKFLFLFHFDELCSVVATRTKRCASSSCGWNIARARQNARGLLFITSQKEAHTKKWILIIDHHLSLLCFRICGRRLAAGDSFYHMCRSINTCW